jgi:Ca-activated chloride channel family protein
MSFASPLALVALVLVPLAVLGYVLVQRRRIRYAARFTNLDLLANIAEGSPGWRRHLPAVLALAALTALLVALARPQATFAVPRDQAGVVLALDTSGSMTATDVAPDRLSAARAAAEAFLEDLPDRFRVGVVEFSSEARAVAAPTDDRDDVRDALESLDANGGTAIGEAIVRSVELIRAGEEEPQGDEQPSPFAILLLSDGANSTGVEPLEAVEEAQEAGVTIYTLALGTDAGTVEVTDPFGGTRIVPVPPDPETLARIAEETGGRFFEAPTEDELAAVYEEIGSRVAYEDEERELTVLFAGAAAVLLLAGGSLSALWFNRIP